MATMLQDRVGMADGLGTGDTVSPRPAESAAARYELVLARVRARGAHLLGGTDGLEAWEREFAAYQGDLAELRRAGDELRPAILRSRQEVLGGEELAREVLELF